MINKVPTTLPYVKKHRFPDLYIEISKTNKQDICMEKHFVYYKDN